MPRGQKNQTNAYSFLRKHFLAGTSFTRTELKAASGWAETTLDTYLNKQFREVIVEESGSMRLSMAFQKISSWPAFQRHVSQNKTLANSYKASCHSDVVIFEFLMPLANELLLREALDALFYRETVKRRLEALPEEVIERKFPRKKREKKATRIKRVLDFVSDKFGGYSISHVSGRFRANDLLKREDATRRVKQGERYLVDETTAIVKFIFPCGQATKLNNLLDPDLDVAEPKDKARNEAEQIRWLFFVLFVEIVTNVVNGEDEIWLIESGMNSRLHIWRN